MALSCVFASGAEESVSQTLTLFRSLGTDGDGTLNAWTVFNGSGGSFVSHVLTLGAGNDYTAGHPDWSDGTFTCRLSPSTSSAPFIRVHMNNNNTNAVHAVLTGGNLLLYKIINSTATQVATVSTGALTAGTFYWLTLQASGTTYTTTLFADSAGAMGAQIATTSAVITDSGVQFGAVGVGEWSGTAGVQVGGAFAGVCKWTGPAPQEWSVQFNTGEPAFAWSSKASVTGARSLSIYLASTTHHGAWNTNAVFPAGTYNVLAQARGPVGASDFQLLFWNGVGFGSTLYNGTGAWQPLAISAATITGANAFLGLNSTSVVGAYYFDNVVVYTGTFPVQAGFAKSSGKYIATFGGQALPSGQGILANINLNDRANAFAFVNGEFTSDDDNVQRGFAQVPYLAKGQWTYDDFGQRLITVPSYYLEDGSHALGAFLAALSQAGEQQLSFDGVTYIPAKYSGSRGRKFQIATSPLWFHSLEFQAREPWFRDLLASSLAAQSLTTDSGTCFGAYYPGSVFSEPIWTLTIPATNGVAINSFQLQNTMSGESLTVNFQSALAGGIPASTARVVTIDCAAMTATDNAGNSFDVSGSFPMLYGPAGNVNPLTTIVTPASGSSSGLTLSGSFQSRWQI